MKRLVLLAAIATALAAPALAQKPFVYDAPPRGRTPPPADAYETRDLNSDWGYIEVYPEGSKEPSTVEVRNQSTGQVYTREDIRASGLSTRDFIAALDARDFAARRARPAPPPADDKALTPEVIPAPERKP